MGIYYGLNWQNGGVQLPTTWLFLAQSWSDSCVCSDNIYIYWRHVNPVKVFFGGTNNPEKDP